MSKTTPKDENKTVSKAVEASPHSLVEGYDDDKADITLISRDDKIFKVESRYLRVFSSVFNDMFANPNIKSGVPAETPLPVEGDSLTAGGDCSSKSHQSDTSLAIPIDYDAKDILTWLNFMHESEPNYSIPDLKRAFEICDAFGCPLVIEGFIYALHSDVREDPWEIFCIASHRDNLPLATAAIAVFGCDDKSALLNAGLPLRMAAEVSLPYLIGFYRLINSKGNQPWDVVASRFSPAQND